jgi:hypothetical protein
LLMWVASLLKYIIHFHCRRDILHFMGDDS